MNTKSTTLESASPTCKHCCEKIRKGAKVCSKCNRPQNRLAYYFELGGVAVAILAVIVSFFQWREARSERIQSEDTLRKIEDTSLVLLELMALTIGTTPTIHGEGVRIQSYPLLKEKTADLLNSLDKENLLRRSRIIEIYVTSEDSEEVERRLLELANGN